jgi:hypothetical protein
MLITIKTMQMLKRSLTPTNGLSPVVKTALPHLDLEAWIPQTSTVEPISRDELYHFQPETGNTLIICGYDHRYVWRN